MGVLRRIGSRGMDIVEIGSGGGVGTSQYCIHEVDITALYPRVGHHRIVSPGEHHSIVSLEGGRSVGLVNMGGRTSYIGWVHGGRDIVRLDPRLGEKVGLDLLERGGMS